MLLQAASKWPLAKIASTALTFLSLGASLTVSAQEREHRTATPVKHLVVIFQENVSFDHYFGTYPFARNPPGEPRFVARRGTPTVNGLLAAGLLNHNPNQVNPFRLDRSHAATCDQDHNYKDEQRAFDGGNMDLFVQTVGNGPGTDGTLTCAKTDVMGYFDGNTVTGFWNYAQHFAMSDNSFSTTFGPSSPGAINLISGDTTGAVPKNLPAVVLAFDVASGSLIGDAQPAFDKCSTRETVQMTGKNIGDLLNAKNITWGWFQGGFRDCKASHIGSDGKPKGDYIPHHEPFQYYQSTSNPNHLPPTSVAMIGHQGDQANDQYDITDFWAAFNADNLPEVSFLKAPGFQDGHAGYSDPLAEQQFVVDIINRLQNSREWDDTAVVILYDDSDGWYDHQMSPIVSQSATPADALNGPGLCGGPNAATNPVQGRCGYGPRQPLLVVSPFAKNNFVDHSITDLSSVTRFIEDNWLGGKRIGGNSLDKDAGTLFNLFDFRGHNDKLFLSPVTGERISGVDDDDE